MQNKEISKLIKLQQDAIQPLVDAHTQVQKYIKHITGILDRQKDVFIPIFKQNKDFADFVEKAKRNKFDTKQVMIESGWWMTPSIMDIPVNWIDEAVLKYKKGNKKAIFNLFRKVYQNDNCKNLELLVLEWKKNPLLNLWSRHLDDALDAHKHKRYTLSVPVLLLIAEGVASDFCKKNNISVKESNGEDKIKKSIKTHYGKTNNVLLSYLDLLENALSSTIYKSTKSLKSNLRKNILNRHAVLHGVKKDYGSMKTSLQAFMLVDMISDLK